MRIAHILTRLLNAGSEENTHLSAIAQRQAGHEVFVIYGADADAGQVALWSRDLELRQLKSLVHPLNPIRDVQATLGMAKLFRTLKIDLVHTHQSKAGIVGRVAARMAKVPTVIHGVHIIPFEQVSAVKSFIYLTAEHICAGLTDAFVHVSDNSRQTYLDKGIGKALPHAVVRSGMDLGRFRNAGWPADWQAITGKNEQGAVPPVMLLIGALEPRKRHLELIAALKASPQRPSDFLLLLAGTGPLEGEIRQAAAAAGLSENVKFLGFRRDPESLIAMANVCLSVGEREGLPRVVIQYLAGYRPAFVTRTMGLDRQIAEHPLCHVYPPGSLQPLTDDVCRALGDAEPRTHDAEANRLLDPWDVPAFVSGLDKVYEAARVR